MKFNIFLIVVFFCLYCLSQGCKNNVTSPSSTTDHNMTVVGRYSTAGYAYGIYVKRIGQINAGFISDGTGGLQIIDVSVPGSPGFLSNYISSGNALSSTVGSINNSSYAFVSCDVQGLEIINVNNLSVPSKDTILSYSNNHVYCSYVDTVNKYLYVGTNNGYMYIYSLSNLPVINLLGTYQTTGGNFNIFSIEVINGLSYLAEGQAGLEIVNVVNPAVPAYFNDFLANGFFFNEVKVSGSYAYIAGGAKLITLNISDPFHLAYVSSYSNSNANYNALVVSASIVYAAAGSGGTEVLSYATPTTPLQFGFYKTGDIATDVFYYNGIIFIADGSDGIYILQYNP